MVHKQANTIIDSNMTKVKKKNSPGIHKYGSTSNWLDEYGRQVDTMHKNIDDVHTEVDLMGEMLDREYKAAEMRNQAAQERISALQEQEEYERQREEEQLHFEQMRQLELEKAQAEVKKVKAEIKATKKRAGPQRVVTTEVKPSLKQKVTKLGKKVAAIVGTAAGHPEVALAAQAVPEGEPTKKKKVKYVEPQYTESGELIYGSWAK
jgi:hypothetical protein